MGSKAGHRARRGVAVRIRRADRDDRDGGPKGGQEIVGRSRGAAVVRDLEHVHRRQSAGQQQRIDVILGVAGEQEAAVLVLAEHHYRGVVGLAVVRRGRVERWRPGRAVVGPQDVERDVVQPKGVAGAEPLGRQAVCREGVEPGSVVGS